MPRKAGIWFREQDGWYYITFRGNQTKLSQDAKEAQAAFHALHAQEPDEEPKGYRPSFRKLADQYLTFTEPVTLRLAETVYRIDPAESKP